MNDEKESSNCIATIYVSKVGLDISGSRMADVIKASVHLVEIPPAWVRVPAAAKKIDVGKTPCTEGAPMIQQDLSGRPAM